MRDADLPPALSGLPVADRGRWAAFREEYHRVHAGLLAEHNAFRASVGVAPCPEDEFNTASPWLNLYEFPAAADYRRARPLDATWHRLESSVRGGEIPGRHTVLFDSVADTIEVTHTARSRGGFALGAVLGAEWLEKRSGFFEVEAFMSALFEESEA